jgi:soluble P-type ATPase
MTKRGLHIDIPGFGILHVKAMCSDYTGTLSFSGKLVSEVRERLCDLSERIDIHIVTSDTQKTARQQLRRLPVTLMGKIPVDRHDKFKRE